MLKITSCDYTPDWVICLSMDMGRLPGLICVSETVDYVQVNWFKEQINRSERKKAHGQHLNHDDCYMVFRRDIILAFNKFNFKKC